MAKAKVWCEPSPLPHGATGSIHWSGGTSPWCRVGLLRANGDVTATSFHHVGAGDIYFTFAGVTATWDGTGGGAIQLELYEETAHGEHLLAIGSGTYLA